MSRYFYNFYGYIVDSDVQFPLENCLPSVISDVKICSQFKNTSLNEDLSIFVCDEEYIIDSSISSFSINKNGNIMNAYYCKKENFLTMIFNIPFSLLSFLKGDLLLHACSIEYRNNIIAFCGQKGTGKSTLLSYLCREFYFYSDDTINIKLKSTRLQTFNSCKILKLTEDSISLHKIKDYSKYERNIQNKLYVPINEIGIKASTGSGLPLKDIYFIIRNPALKKININEINDIFIKSTFLLSNIVGIDYFSADLIFKIQSNELFSYILNHVKFYKLEIPDGLEKLNYVYDELYHRITST